ncbi:hypothetical protein [Francisella sp. LA112445]|uniref:hypothetical protein n=1 Tax=Francisella sp. LA112445 TaxID=1395624 RepID=UPI001788C126|nr:hypothetical protein [Francisella sp. LA112445]QIW10499.1 hypothetical protein FIP56_07235 [Francisella sp. LA112445]
MSNNEENQNNLIEGTQEGLDLRGKLHDVVGNEAAGKVYERISNGLDIALINKESCKYRR